MMNKSKRIGLFLIGVLLYACAGNLYAQQTLGLDEVITQAAKDVETRLSAGAKLAVLNFTSTAEAFSDYVIEELSGALVMNRKVTIIERRSLDLIRKEMNLQLSGDVSDDSAQAIGKQLGAQAIVTGALTNLGDTYRFRVKVINVETARIEAQFSYNLGNNQQVAFLLSGSQTDPTVSPDGAGNSGTVATAQVNKVYKVGDIGPARGLIFYVNPEADDWKYLEAAPASTEKVTFWASDSFPAEPITQVRSVGTGKSNSAYIMKSGNERGGGFDWAAEVCESLEVNGYSDWFLPSRDELHQMWGNLQRKGLGGFKSDWYWSSTASTHSWNLNNYIGAWSENFSNGEQNNGYGGGSIFNTSKKARVRAIRQF